MAGDVEASVVACWRGDGVLTVLPPARWCPKRRDPTINMKVVGVEGSGGGSVTKGRSRVVFFTGGSSIK